MLEIYLIVGNIPMHQENELEVEYYLVSDVKQSRICCHGGWNDASAVSNLSYSCGGPEFDAQYNARNLISACNFSFLGI